MYRQQTDDAVAQLPRGWFVLSEVVVRSGHVDRPEHLVEKVLVGPPGIFVVGTAVHPSGGGAPHEGAGDLGSLEQRAAELAAAARALRRELLWDAAGRADELTVGAQTLAPILAVHHLDEEGQVRAAHGGPPLPAALNRVEVEAAARLGPDLENRAHVLDPHVVRWLAQAVRRLTDVGGRTAGTRHVKQDPPRRTPGPAPSPSRRRTRAVTASVLTVVVAAGTSVALVSTLVPDDSSTDGLAGSSTVRPSMSPEESPPPVPQVPAEAAPSPMAQDEPVTATALVTSRDWGTVTGVPSFGELPPVEVVLPRPTRSDVEVSGGTLWSSRVEVSNGGTDPLPLSAVSWSLVGADREARWRAGLLEDALVAPTGEGDSVAPGAEAVVDVTWVLPDGVSPEAGSVEIGDAGVTWR